MRHRTLFYEIMGFNLLCNRLQSIDTPNHRSSHNASTTRGDGIGLVMAGSLAGLCLLVMSSFDLYVLVVLVISCFVAAVGLQDDRKSTSARLRLAIHMVLAAVLLMILGGSVEMQHFVEDWVSRTLIDAFLMLVIVWWINLFNSRMLTQKRWLEGHSTHLYQRLARRFGIHSHVTLIYLAVNLLWLLPLAFLCTRIPQSAVGLAAIAYLPLIAVAILMGAGKADD